MNRLLSLFKIKPTRFKRYKIFFQELQGCYGYLFAHLWARFMPRKSSDTLADNLHDVMVETLPTMVDKHIKEQVMKEVPEQVRNQVPVYVAEGLILERQKAKEETERLIAKAILQERGNIQAQILTQIENAIANVIPSQVDTFVRNQQYQLYLSMKADPQLQQQDIAIWLALQMKFERTTVPQSACRTPAVRQRYQDDPHDDAHLEGENSVKRHKTLEYEAYVSAESSFGQVFQEEQAPSTSGNQDQDDDFDFWTDSYASDDDEIPTKRANKYLVSITEPDYKNLNKNDIEDIYLLIMNGKVPYYADTGLLWSLSIFIRSTVIWERVHDFQLIIESYQQKVNLTAPTMTFLRIEDHEMLFIIYEPVQGIIYKNSKKEKRVIRHSEIHKFCDATLNRVLEGLKSYNNDIKYGYVQKDLTKDEGEYLKLFEEEIEERLKHRRQMRRWEMFVNGRPLGPRRERPE
ncbi:hypothetical protein Tco_0981049 [Tanacetum coccineum]